MDYQELKFLEDDLWDAADQLRANSKLTASEYSMPVLGLIFLRHATTRFNALLPEVEKAVPACIASAAVVAQRSSPRIDRMSCRSPSRRITSR